MSDATPSTRVQVRAIRNMRVINAAERPNDAIIELTTSEGAQHFSLPKEQLANLILALSRFSTKHGPAPKDE
jgi:hypothetical protein